MSEAAVNRDEWVPELSLQTSDDTAYVVCGAGEPLVFIHGV